MLRVLGCGALIARREACEAVLKGKRYFGGGTVQAVAASEHFHVLRADWPSRLEDGTAAFTAIAQLDAGFHTLNSLAGGMTAVQRHTCSLAQATADRLSKLEHYNGAPVVQLYGPWNNAQCEMGSIVSFNCLKPDGAPVGFAEVAQVPAC